MKKKLSGLALMLLLLVGFSMSAFAANNPGFAAAASAAIVDSQTVQYTAQLPSVPQSDDGMLYLYELRPFQYDVTAGMTPIGATAMSQTPVFNFPLNRNAGAASRLYSKFALVVNQGGQPSIIANPQYVTNPEAVAVSSRRAARPAKTTQDASLTNILLNGAGAANGNAAVVGQTIQLLAGDSSGAVIHPYGRGAIGDSHPVAHTYYMFNAMEDAGIQAIINDLTYYAGPGSNGQDFLVGNEVNERQYFDYMAWPGSWDAFVREYANAFRVMYNCIKSQNAQARVYVSLDQCWDRNRAADQFLYIDGKDFMDKFNAIMLSEGNIDWDVAIHPYTVPLTNAQFWTQGGYEAGQVASGAMVSFQNMSVITNYLTQPHFLNRAGQPRDFIINEIGLSATKGDQIQGAAIAASYAAFERNPFVTQYMYLNNVGGGVDATMSGQALAVYNAMGTAEEEKYMNWAKSVIGISDWGQVLR